MLSAEPIAKRRIHFPESGYSKPIEQLVNFTDGSNDDLADAITQLIYYVYQTESPKFKKSAKFIGPIKIAGMYRSLRVKGHFALVFG